MRKVALLLIVGGLLLVFAVPAQAKGKEPVFVRITGPGLSTPIVIRGDMGDPPGDPFWAFVWLAFRSTGSPGAEAPPDSATLGPAYSTLYADPCCGFRVHQVIYPYAAGGPLTFTPPAQGRDLFQMNFTDTLGGAPGGWYRASSPMLATLFSHGLPRLTTAPQPRGNNRPMDPAWLAIGIGLSLAIGLLLLRAHRSQQTHVPA
jgi:hypothetical protein